MRDNGLIGCTGSKDQDHWAITFIMGDGLIKVQVSIKDPLSISLSISLLPSAPNVL